MALKLHYIVASTYSQKALLAFYEKGVEFEPAQVDFSSDAGRAAYKEIYSLGKIPLLTGDDVFIPESTTIVEYLEDTFPQQGTQLIPTEKVAARRTRFKDRMIDLYINESILKIFFDGRKPVEERDPEGVAKAHATMDQVLPHFEKELASQTYLGGDNVSLADCALFGPLFYAQQLHPTTTQYPHLTAYFQRMMARASVQKMMAELMPFLEAFNTKN